MRVLHIVSHFNLGGAERVALNLAKSTNENITYYILEVVRGKGDYSDSFIDEMNQSHIKYFRSPIKHNKLAILLFPFWFILILRRIRPNVIHTHTEIPDLSVFLSYYLCYPCLKNVKFVRTIHNTKLWNKWDYIGEKVERFFLTKKANVAISLSTQQSYLQKYGNSPIVIFNGLECVQQEIFESIVKGKINILFAGRIEYQKGINELIEIIKALKDDKRYVFHIVGDGSLKKNMIHALNGQTNVFFYDPILGLSSFLFSFDFLLMPSNFEGLGLMSIEASLAKLPSIINSCPGLCETLPDNWPLKVSNNNIDKYLYLFKSVLPVVQRYKLGNEAYEFVKENFSLKTMRNKYESLYGK